MTPLVDYESSPSPSSDENQDQFLGARRKRARTDEAPLPSLPPAFRNLYTTASRISTQDDPALHGGRRRQVPHVEGNWPSHVFIEWHPSAEHASMLSSLVDSVSSVTPAKVHSSLASDLGVPLPLHISLSSPLVLRTEQRDAFLSSVTKSVQQACPEGAFEVSLGELLWASNDNGTRWFLTIGVEGNKLGKTNSLRRLLDACNSVAAARGQPQLYTSSVAEPAPSTSDKFHFSIGWTLTSPLPHGKQVGAVAGLAADDPFLRAVAGTAVRVDTVKVKIGSSVSSIALDGMIS